MNSCVQYFHCSDKNKICVHAHTTEYELYNFKDYVYNLNALTCNHLKLALHNIKMNGDIHVN